MTTPFTFFRPGLHWLGSVAVAALVCSGAVQAAPIADERLSFSGQVTVQSPHRFADVILTGDVITSGLVLNVPAEDVGKTANLFLVALIRENQGSRAYMQVNGKWLAWSGRLADLQAERRTPLGLTEAFSVLTAEPLFEGDYQVYAGYQTDGDSLRYMARAYTFGVQDDTSEALVKFSSDTAMLDYLRGGMDKASADTSYYRTLDMVAIASTAGSASPDAAPSLAETTAASRSSGTNLQESGVDESDTIKVSDDLLFMLASCTEGACLQVQRLDSTNATSELLASYDFAAEQIPDSLYLVEKAAGTRSLVTLSSQGYYGGWFRIWGWGENKTSLEFLNVDENLAITQTEKLSIDGAMVASRRIGDTLYLVTRYSPNVPGYIIYPLDKAQQEANTGLLEETALPDILPRVETASEDLLALIQSQDCYLPTSAVDGGRDPSIITITSIPLEAPSAFTSTCFLGGSEALYMTTDALYLATTSWEYNNLAEDALFYSPEHTTSIHKFALENGGVSYRGSGAVKGHLGWVDDKKSFRMGQNGGFLNVVTSVGETWDGSSSTRLSVLREAATGRQLETVSVIDGIGKPNEQLYAARFLGDRAYLVTFRLTDPLYVLDLSDQPRPQIAGELQIDGYSDYLHPVTDTLLLGVGKDAIADEQSSDFGGGRGAWYQGLKLALFDVADMSNPREVSSVVLGKRGTDSDVLWDHHAFSFLPATASEPARVAFAVQLHDKVPELENFDPSSASAWYDYTHTALYSFEVSGLGISQAGVLISEVAREGTDINPVDLIVVDSTTSKDGAGSDPAVPVEGETLLPAPPLFAPVYVYYNDRSVLRDDAVFYIHSGKVLSSFWGESK